MKKVEKKNIKDEKVTTSPSIAMISKDELKELNDLKKDYDDNQFRLGGLEIQKSNVVNNTAVISSRFSAKMKAIGEKYGKGSVDLETGVLTLE